MVTGDSDSTASLAAIVELLVHQGSLRTALRLRERGFCCRQVDRVAPSGASLARLGHLTTRCPRAPGAGRYGPRPRWLRKPRSPTNRPVPVCAATDGAHVH